MDVRKKGKNNYIRGVFTHGEGRHAKRGGEEMKKVRQWYLTRKGGGAQHSTKE